MWKYRLTIEADHDFDRLDHSQQKYALAMLEKLKENPLPRQRGGYGHPLGNDRTTGNLTGFYKLKSRGSGLRIVYKLIEKESESVVIVIGMREEKEVYKIASKRVKQNAKKGEL